MKLLRIIPLLLVLLFITPSCHKTIVVVPFARMTLSASTIHLKDTLIISNYSKSDEALVFLMDSVQARTTSYLQHTGTDYIFDKTNKMQYVFTNPGFYHVYLQAINEETLAPVKTDSATVRVLP